MTFIVDSNIFIFFHIRFKVHITYLLLSTHKFFALYFLSILIKRFSLQFEKDQI